ncbi:serine hydrolase domain-containing protein [Roseivirga sp. BDSF3-8]|uniref:serine hydrolase domain-containing protein n=1 Tax=Roseivirga sp. BDSF3-8 TaxID=3241598 RepID=UPI003531DB69
MMKKYLLLCLVLGLFACEKDDVSPTDKIPGQEIYFPPLTGEEWETTTPAELGWNEQKLQELYSFLESNGTRAFIVLKNGRIVTEKYWGENITRTAPFDKDSQWYWASAGKTITAFLVGRAQFDRLLSISDKTSEYLGTGWTSMSAAREEQITIRHQLTMTTGLDYTVNDIHCTDPECLDYMADPGTRWYYHNAPYTLLEQVISNASGMSYNAYTDEKLEDKTGMSGTWIQSGYNNVYWSKPRDAARFGLLVLNNGLWDDMPVLSDTSYIRDMISPSQSLNPSYGYLWWLNGQPSAVFPGSPDSYNIAVAPDAPSDLYAAMGKNGQIIDVVPEENLIVVRMGEAPDNALVPITFHNQMWQYLNEVLP